MGKAIDENPQLSVYYNDREHVTIHSTNSSQALSTNSHAIHKTSSDHTYHMLQSAPPICLPLLHNPR